MQSFKIVASLLLDDSGGYVKFTPKYTKVGGEGSNLIRLVTKEPMQNFKIVA